MLSENICENCDINYTDFIGLQYHLFFEHQIKITKADDVFYKCSCSTKQFRSRGLKQHLRQKHQIYLRHDERHVDVFFILDHYVTYFCHDDNQIHIFNFDGQTFYHFLVLLQNHNVPIRFQNFGFMCIECNCSLTKENIIQHLRSVHNFTEISEHRDDLPVESKKYNFIDYICQKTVPGVRNTECGICFSPLSDLIILCPECRNGCCLQTCSKPHLENSMSCPSCRFSYS